MKETMTFCGKCFFVYVQKLQQPSLYVPKNSEFYGSYPRFVPVLTPAQYEEKFCLLFPFQFFISHSLSFILFAELFSYSTCRISRATLTGTRWLHKSCLMASWPDTFVSFLRTGVVYLVWESSCTGQAVRVTKHITANSYLILVWVIIIFIIIIL